MDISKTSGSLRKRRSEPTPREGRTLPSRNTRKGRWGPGSWRTSSSSMEIHSAIQRQSTDAGCERHGWADVASSLRRNRDRAAGRVAAFASRRQESFADTAARNARKTLPHTFPSVRILFSKLFSDAHASNAAVVFASNLPEAEPW